MRDPNWYPKNTHYNIYNKSDHSRDTAGKIIEHGRFN